MAQQVCVVTGGRGFVGRHLVARLIEEGTWIVRILDIAPQLILSEAETSGPLPKAIENGRLEYFQGDITVPEQVSKAVQGASVVFHMASANPNTEDFAVHYAVNVIGTKNIIRSCVDHGVLSLIYTSSASVVFNGREDIVGGGEGLPYPAQPLNAYSETKAQGEALVLAANEKGGGRSSTKGLSTLSLRPSNIFGPGDPVLVPLSVKNAAAGKLKFRIGNGENCADWTFVDNVVHAHICAERALRETNAAAGGKAFFVTNGEPTEFWGFIYGLVGPLGYTTGPLASLPVSLILPLAHASSSLASLLSSSFGIQTHSDFTPSRIRIATKWRTFDPSAAESLIGYKPIVPLKEGVDRTLRSFQHLRAEVYLPALMKTDGHTAGQTESGNGKLGRKISRTRAALGNGQVADLLLWTSPWSSLLLLLTLLLLHRFFFSSSLPLLSLLSSRSILLLILAFAYNKLQLAAPRFGLPLPPLPLPSIHEAWVAEPTLRDLTRGFNSRVALPLHRALAQPNTGSLVQLLAAILLVKWLFGGLHLPTLLLLVLVGAAAIPPLLERYEDRLATLVTETKVLIQH